MTSPVDLGDVAGRRVGVLSGGNRRNADLAASQIGAPAVLFLDEPTTGLDPRARLRLWAAIEDLKGAGTTVVLTTQYLEEADRLAGRIVVIDRGAVIAQGTPAELKRRVGGLSMRLRLADQHQTARFTSAVHALDGVSAVTAGAQSGELQLAVADASVSTRIISEADRLGLPLAELTVSTPTLDDVFLHLTDAPTPVAA